MKRSISTFLFLLSWFITPYAQTIIRGTVLDANSENPLHGVSVILKGSDLKVLTDKKGSFIIRNIAFGKATLEIHFQGYESQYFPLTICNTTIDLGVIYLYEKFEEITDLSLINITDDELNSEDGYADNITGLLQSSRDVFDKAAAFDFSATFFKPRGFDSSNGKVLINSIEMNKLYNGRPQWANWGGMNDLQRNQSFTRGIRANENTFGDIAGINNITMRASKYRPGTKISYASSNRSYQGRLMISHSSGSLSKGWSYSFLISRRFGDQGYINGTLYDASSFFATVEKQINKDHNLNLNFIYAYNRRGRSTALTQEIYELKGRKYNPHWGSFNGDQINSRERRIVEPILMLNHYWNVSQGSSLNTNIMFQSGLIGSTRIDNGGTRLITFEDEEIYIGGARNPSPDYYQNLPSFFLNLENPSAYDYQQAYLAQVEFVKNGQFDWEKILRANDSQNVLIRNSVYALQEDRVDDRQLSINSIYYTQLNENIQLNASISYRSLQNETYAKIKDLLGGSGFLDVDFFAETQAEEIISNIAQSDARNPNRIAKTGDRYKYNYQLKASSTDAFLQAQFNYSKLDFYVGTNVNRTSYQRNGLYENGYFQGENLSFGKSNKASFNNFGFKSGFTYKINGQHLLDLNMAYLLKAPVLRNSFENPRQNNRIVKDLESEKISNIDLSYIVRTPIIRSRLTTYYTQFNQGTDVGFFFTESGNAFVQEVITNISRRNYGLEIGIETRLSSTIRLKSVASIGEFIYTNNPNIYYSSNNFNNRIRYGDGTTKLRNYHVGSGPERAFQLGFEYRDPDYWWFGATANHFSKSFVDPSALKRTDAFLIDFDLVTNDQFEEGNILGPTFNDYDPFIAKDLLKPEEFPSFLLVNISGGKSWKVGSYFIGFFATVNNLFNEVYRTGGFEQSRRIGYRDQIQEQYSSSGPVFGNRYFYGLGTTYFLNLYLRF